uniref:cytochrome c oxidase subunit 3 n=1 Tax=Phytophthora plurivora TaxID=639000 RepID=UPI002028E8DC|nr:cytochrome c oxidase subunit 3 [Phytophthora plurivora]UXG55743.1 cytochrome c oxidase subunit 3 [Phytophthora plurivora]DAZ89303.1 TPA_asm: cytochrome c oxidase subunit 3 [Phytophthora plurivora]
MENYYYINKKNLQIETTTNDSNIDKLKNDLTFLKKITQNTQNTQNHPYHLVDPSPWPFVISFGLFFLTFGGAMYFHGYIGSNLLTLTGFLMVILTMYTWFRDIVREAVYEGQHTKQVQLGLRNGMLLFIFSELLFFISFFWAFFHSALAPTPEIGSLWPPLGIETVNAWGIPLLNTIILLSSGATITWAHHSIVFGDRKNSILSLIITILLAFFFTLIQAYEYIESTFSISDSIYGTTFFLLTGFHGIHVIVGTIFIIVSTIRLINHHFTKQHHFGFEAAAWYWHFVDVVWLFLFVAVYWWGGN